MKTIKSIIYLLPFIFFFVSCNEEEVIEASSSEKVVISQQESFRSVPNFYGFNSFIPAPRVHNGRGLFPRELECYDFAIDFSKQLQKTYPSKSYFYYAKRYPFYNFKIKRTYKTMSFYVDGDGDVDTQNYVNKFNNLVYKTVNELGIAGKVISVRFITFDYDTCNERSNNNYLKFKLEFVYRDSKKIFFPTDKEPNDRKPNGRI